jgi:phage shock protein A
MTRIATFIAFFAVVAAGSLRAEDKAAAAELKLREMLRNTMLQLRDAQGQLAALQATQAENEQKIKDLTTQLEKSTKDAASAKTASDKKISELSDQSTQQGEEISRYKIALDKWKQGYDAASELARQKEAARAKLESIAIGLQRKVDDQQRKNDALFAIGNEILSRYENFGLGNALANKEPFVGVTRVKFQNLIQSYQDKLIEQKIR